ncbi:helix-turn-helix transcriptional regulator [Embleya sp. AB8]|uniref:helix-turn-helix transcriptional regulator n=1 Tax=Embleya sp. AB8 TaxID=3156304 RepID=UPI003C747830
MTRRADADGWKRDELLVRAAAAPDALALFATASTRLRRLVPFDAAVWRATDPLTGLIAAPIRVENLDEGGCAAFWTSESDPNTVNPFRALAAARIPAAALRESTGDRPEASPLHAAYLRPRRLGDELRAVLRVAGRPWGSVSLFRNADGPAFTAAETELVAGLSAPLAGRLRAFLRPGVVPEEAVAAPEEGTGVLLFDRAGRLVSANDQARARIASVAGDAADGTIPIWIATLVAAGTGRVRVRTRAGRWLVCQASRLDGDDAFTVVMLEPAPVAEVASIIVEAYELTTRETEITRLVAAGLATDEIARRLGITTHTVRDHIKAVLAKVGVASRGELVAKLFTEYVAPANELSVARIRSAS